MLFKCNSAPEHYTPQLSRENTDTKFNSCQYFRLYGNASVHTYILGDPLSLHVFQGWYILKITINISRAERFLRNSVDLRLVRIGSECSTDKHAPQTGIC